MIFRPELAEAVMAGRKTVTRRLVQENPASPWYVEKCALQVDRSYAVQPGRGVAAIGRVRILSVARERFDPSKITPPEARAEGFATYKEFVATWKQLHGNLLPLSVWRIEFAVIAPEDYALWEGS